MSTGRGRSVVFWGLLSVLLLGVALVVARRGPGTEPLDPRSVGPSGARGLVELLEAVGGEVTLGVEGPGPGDDVAVMLADRADPDRRTALLDWVRAGGRLVVADPASPLLPDSRPLVDSTVDRGQCDVAALVGVERVRGLGVAFATDGTEACFDGSVVVIETGLGTLVGMGGQQPLLNESLDEADNAALAVALLAPRPGTRLAFIEGSPFAAADAETLTDLIADPVWVLAAQIGLGFVYYAWFRARRLGRPVVESSEVLIESAELAAARGRLLQGIGRPDAAVVDLRSSTRRLLLRRFGLPADTPDAVLAEYVAAHSALSADEVAALLVRRNAATDNDLYEIAAGLGRLRSELLVHAPVAPTGESP